MACTFGEFMIITNHRCIETIRRWASPSERVGDIYCRKDRTQVDLDPLHIHAGLKSVASPAQTGTERGTGKKENRRDHGENPDYSWREVVRATAISVCLNSAGKGNTRSMIADFVVCSLAESVSKIYFRYTSGARDNVRKKMNSGCDYLVITAFLTV